MKIGKDIPYLRRLEKAIRLNEAIRTLEAIERGVDSIVYLEARIKELNKEEK